MQRFKPSAKPLADLVADTLSPALAAKGFAGREVVARWPEIAGERLSARSRPQKIEWPRQRPGADGDALNATSQTATLVVLVESAFAPELQHAAPLVLARVNAHLGWPAVGRLLLKQGPVASARSRQPAPQALPPEQTRAIASACEPIADPSLREAVTRLGLAIARQGRS